MGNFNKNFSCVKPFSTILRAGVKIISPSVPKIPNICFIYLVCNKDPTHYNEKKLSRKSAYHKYFVIELFLDSLAYAKTKCTKIYA